MKQWLLLSAIQLAMENAPRLSSDQVGEAMAAIGGPRPNAERVMEVSNGTATINVSGVMTSQPDFMAYLFGGGNTLYGDLASAIRSAEADPKVDRVNFAFNSGGGEAQPVVEVGDMIAAMTKPTTAVVETAASAAYWLASQADTIVARNRASRVGSIGVVVGARKPSESSFVEVTSTDAPNKRPDPETDEGQAIIRTQIDPMHELFATAVAVGRDISVEKVNNDYGQGGMLIAGDALKVGMIDAIGQQQNETNHTTTTTTGAKIMDLAMLKADHPAVFAEAVAIGQIEGAAAELDRVKFHAKMGEKTGATAIALSACLNGTAKDDGETQAEYMAAGMNKNDVDNFKADESDLGDNAPGATDQATIENASLNAIFGNAAEHMGVEL